MDITFVTRFLTVVELGSLNKASQKLNLSQPALSKSIRLLEEGLGVPLLNRAPRGISLTSYGVSVFEHARRISSEMRKMENQIEAIRTLSYGEINVGAPLGPDSRNLVLSVLQLIKENRRIEINISNGTRAELIRPLMLGDLDFMISTLFEPEDMPDDVDQCELYLDTMTLAVRKGHPILKKGEGKISQLTSYPWVALSVNRDMERALKKLISSNFNNSVLRSSSPRFVKNILAKSDCIGLVRQDAVSVELNNRSLIEIDVSSKFKMTKLFPPQKVGLIYRSNIALSHASQALISEIKLTVTQESHQNADFPKPVKI